MMQLNKLHAKFPGIDKPELDPPLDDLERTNSDRLRGDVQMLAGRIDLPHLGNPSSIQATILP